MCIRICICIYIYTLCSRYPGGTTIVSSIEVADPEKAEKNAASALLDLEVPFRTSLGKVTLAIRMV